MGQTTTTTKPRYQSTRAIIDAFRDDKTSGRARVATIAGVSKNAVSNWYRTGIPYRHEQTIIHAAREYGLRGVTSNLIQTLKRK